MSSSATPSRISGFKDDDAMHQNTRSAFRSLLCTLLVGGLLWSLLVWFAAPTATALWLDADANVERVEESVLMHHHQTTQQQQQRETVPPPTGLSAAQAAASKLTRTKEGPSPLGASRVDRHAAMLKLQQAVAKQQKLVVDRWGKGEAPFERSMPTVGNEAVLGSKFAASLLTRRPFVVGCVGSSNTAAHDNKFEDAYPSRLVAPLSQLLESVGASVVLRNHGVGNTWTMPQGLCLLEIVGEPLDVVIWEYAMNDAGNQQYEMDWYETWIRNALRLQGQPVPHFVMIEGGRRKGDYKGKEPGPRPAAQLPNNHRQATVTRLTDHYFEFNVRWMFQIDALAAYDHEPKFAYETLFVTFHPGPQGHQHLADQLLYYYLKCLDMGIQMVLGALQSEDLTDQQIMDAYGQPRQRPLPAPLACEERVCAETSPECRTANEPRQGPGLQSALVEANGWTWQEVPGQKHHPENGILDVKRCFLGDSETSGWLKLSLTVPAEGIVVVCEAAAEWARPPEWGSLKDDAEFTIDGQPPPRRNDGHNDLRLFNGPKMRDSCVMVTSVLQAGSKPVVGIRVKTPGKSLYISQLIAI